MNATTRPTLAASTALSSPRRPAAGPASARPVAVMDPAKYPALRDALGEIQSALYLAQAGVELLDPDEPKGLEFIATALRGHLDHLEEHIEIAQKASFAIAPRLSDEDATRTLVETLVRQERIGIAEVEWPDLVHAYKAERAEAEEGVACGVLLDRALRRMKTSPREKSPEASATVAQTPSAATAISPDRILITAADKHRAAAEAFYRAAQNDAYPKKEARYLATLAALTAAPAPTTLEGFQKMAAAILADATSPDGDVTVKSLQGSETTQRMVLTLLHGLRGND